MTATVADTPQVTRCPAAVDLPGALTHQGTTRVGAAIASSHARNTRLAYAGQWRRFTDWMRHRGRLSKNTPRLLHCRSTASGRSREEPRAGQLPGGVP